MAAPDVPPMGPSESTARDGAPNDPEVEVDVLSTDAVRIRPGTRVVRTLGRRQALEGVVHVVEPAGFTSVSPSASRNSERRD